MYLASEHIIQTVGTVWEAMLALPVEPAADAEPPPGEADRVAAAVHITGPWTGAVVLWCDVDTARVAAAVMFGTDPAAAPADLYDAVAELANMVGGNLKGLMPEGCLLSLPRPADPPAPGASPPTQCVAFTCLARPCRVEISQQADCPTAAAA